MARRRIDRADICAVLNGCSEDPYPPKRRGTEEHVAVVRWRRLKVILDRGSNPPHVVTAFFLRRTRP
jgi:hypothetical protein